MAAEQPAPPDALPRETADRILAAFLELAAERGADATTTRLVAERAGVNEVTVFRHFGDKATLAREAVRRWHPRAALAAYQPAIDPSTPDRALEGLLACLRFLRGQMDEHRAVLQFGLGEYWRFPELKEEIGSAPRAARRLLERALAEAAPALRPEVDPEVTAIGLIGLLLTGQIWQSRGWLDWQEADWERALRAALRPLLRCPDGAGGGPIPGTVAREGARHGDHPDDA